MRMSSPALAPRTEKTGEHSMECSLRLPLPDAASASVLWNVLKTDPAIVGTIKQVYWWSEDASQRTVGVTIQATSKRDLRSAVGAVLEQAKLVVRTLRVYPPSSSTSTSSATV